MPAAAGFDAVTKWYEESRMAPGPVPWPFMLKMPGANGARFTVCGALVWPARVAVTAGGCPASSHGICKVHLAAGSVKQRRLDRAERQGQTPKAGGQGNSERPGWRAEQKVSVDRCDAAR